MVNTLPWWTNQFSQSRIDLYHSINQPMNGVIWTPVSLISNGTLSSMMCHSKSGTCFPGHCIYQIDVQVNERKTYITSPRREFFGDQIRERSLNFAKRGLRNIDIDVSLYGTSERPS